jgi:ribose 5-phosphate isomerase B
VRVALGSDEDTALVAAVRRQLEAAGHEVVEPVAVGDPWPEVGRSVGEAVAGGAADVGIVCCWTGTGVSIAANKVTGVRAALCVDAETAAGARRWNDANVLALSNRLTTPAVGEGIVAAFLATTDVDPAERANIALVEDGPASG